MRFTKEAERIKAYFNFTPKYKTKFLWFPVTIDGETRWLETATIEYRVNRDRGVFYDSYYWTPWRFIDEELKNK